MASFGCPAEHRRALGTGDSEAGAEPGLSRSGRASSVAEAGATPLAPEDDRAGALAGGGAKPVDSRRQQNQHLDRSWTNTAGSRRWQSQRPGRSWRSAGVGEASGSVWHDAFLTKQDKRANLAACAAVLMHIPAVAPWIAGHANGLEVPTLQASRAGSSSVPRLCPPCYPAPSVRPCCRCA